MEATGGPRNPLIEVVLDAWKKAEAEVEPEIRGAEVKGLSSICLRALESS